jgi:hypothetical protein
LIGAVAANSRKINSAPFKKTQRIQPRLLGDLKESPVTALEGTQVSAHGLARRADLSLMPAVHIAEAAKQFGQEDDITVMTLALTGA